MPKRVKLEDGRVLNFGDDVSESEMRDAIEGLVSKSETAVDRLNAQPSFSSLPGVANEADVEGYKQARDAAMAANAKPVPNPLPEMIGRAASSLSYRGSPTSRLEPMLPSGNDLRKLREKLTPIIGPTELQAEAAAEGGMPQPEGLIPSLSKPIVPVPRIPQQEGTAAQIGAGAANALIGAAEFFESPFGVATLGAAFAPRAVQKAIGAAFTADMARQLPTQGEAAGRLSVEGTPQEKTEAYTGIGLTSAMGAAPFIPSVSGPRLAREAALQRPMEMNRAEALAPRRPEDIVTSKPQPEPTLPGSRPQVPLRQWEQDVAAYEQAMKPVAPKGITVRGEIKPVSGEMKLSEAEGGVFRSEDGIIGQLKKDESGRYVLEDNGKYYELPGSAEGTIADAGIRPLSLNESRTFREPSQYPEKPLGTVSKLQESRNRAMVRNLSKQAASTPVAKIVEAPETKAPTIEIPKAHSDLMRAISNVIAKGKNATQSELYGALEAAPTAKRVIEGYINRMESAKVGANYIDELYGKLDAIEKFENTYLDVVTKPSKQRKAATTAEIVGGDIEALKKSDPEIAKIEEAIRGVESQPSISVGVIEPSGAWEGTVYRGEPKSKQSAFGAGIYSRSAHGSGKYFGISKEDAQRFSAEGTVRSEKVRLENPYIVKSDADVLRMRKEASEASGKPISQDWSSLLDKPQGDALTEGLTKLGYDGVIVDYKEANGGRQVVQFKPEPPTTGEPNALRKQISDESLLRAAEPQPEVGVGLQEVGKRNAEPEIAPARAEGEQGGLSGAKEEAVGLPEKVRIAGAVYDVVSRNPDGTLRVKSEGGEFDLGANESWEPVSVSKTETESKPKQGQSRQDFIAQELAAKKAVRKIALLEAENAIRKNWNPSKPLPVGISKISALEAKSKHTKAERELLTKLNIARRNLEADTRSDAEHYGRVYDRIKSTPAQPAPVEAKGEGREIGKPKSELSNLGYGIEVLSDQKTGNKPIIAVKLDDGSVLFSKKWGAHIDAAGSLPEPILDRIVDGGFVVNGKWDSGGDLSQGLKPGEKVPDYYGIRKSEPALDSFTQLLDKGIEATKIDPKNLQEGVTGAPVWMTKAAVNGALRIIKVTYEATKDAAKAIQNAIVWLRSQNVKGFNEAEARKFLEENYNPNVVAESAKSATPPITPPPLPEGTGADTGPVRMRSISARATNLEELPPEVRKKIEQDPNSFYRQQSMEAAKKSVESMTDTELAAMTPMDNRYTVGKIELVNRLNQSGRFEEARSVIADLAPELTKSGQIINLAKFFNLLKPEQVVDLVNDNLVKNNRDPLKPEVAQRLLNLSQERINAKAKFDKAASDWKNEPNEANAEKVDKASEDWRIATLEEQKLRLRLEYRSGLDLFKTLVQGNLLSPISFAYNLAGNTTFLPFNVASRYGGNWIGAIDSAITKRPRMDKVAPLKEAVAWIEGALEGGSKFKDIMSKGSQDINTGDTRPGLHPLEAMAKLVSKENIPTKGGRIPLAEYMKLAVEAAPFSMTAEASLRMLAAGDAPFRQAARNRIIESVSEFENIPKSQRGFAKRHPELVFDSETYKRIMDETDAAVFQADSATINALNRWIRSKGPIMDVISTVIAPYKLTPLNIAKQLASFDPAFGVAMGALELKKGNRLQAHRYLASAVIGATLYGVSEWLYKKGLIFPALDTQDEEQKARMISEDVSNRLNISGLKRAFKGEDTTWRPGDETVDFFRIGGPLGVSMYIIANSNREVEKSNTTRGDSVLNVYGFGLLQRMSFTMTQSFLKSASEVLNSLREKNFNKIGDSVASTISSSFLPNTMSAISRATRDYKVDVNDKEFTNRVEKMLRSKLGWAGLDDYMTLKRGLFGEPLRETPEGANPFFYQFFDITKGRQVTDDPVKLELYRLWRKSAEGKVLPEPPNDKTIVRGKKKYEMTREQASDLAEMVGTARKKIADALVQNPRYDEVSDDVKIRLWTRAWDHGSKIGRAQFSKKYGAELPEVQKRTGFEVR